MPGTGGHSTGGQEPGVSQGMCKVATAGLGGGKSHAFNKVFKERKRVGVREKVGVYRQVKIWRLEDRRESVPMMLSQVWGKVSPDALGHHLLLPPLFLAFMNGRFLSRAAVGCPLQHWVGVEHHPNSTCLERGLGWVGFTCSQGKVRHLP